MGTFDVKRVSDEYFCPITVPYCSSLNSFSMNGHLFLHDTRRPTHCCGRGRKGIRQLRNWAPEKETIGKKSWDQDQALPLRISILQYLRSTHSRCTNRKSETTGRGGLGIILRCHTKSQKRAEILPRTEIPIR